MIAGAIAYRLAGNRILRMALVPTETFQAQASVDPRVYADANIPAGLVAHMRAALGWDVLFVLEDEALRRAYLG